MRGAPLPSVPNWARRAEVAEARLAAIDALLKEAIAAYNALPAKVEAPATEVQS